MANEDFIIEMLKRIQADGAETRRRSESVEMRMSAFEDHLRGVMTSLAGIHADFIQLNSRVERIVRRLDLIEA